MGDKFDTYEKQNMGQCAEKKIHKMYRYTTSWGAVCPVKTYTVGLVCKKKSLPKCS